MYSIGMTTIFLYLGSVVSFLLAVQFANFFLFGIGLGALFFIVASVILLGMMSKRADRQDF